MIKEYQYTSIKEIMANIREHPLMEDVTLDRVIRYTIQFIAKMGMPKLYENRQEDIAIENYRGVLPCDLISIIQVKDTNSDICLRAITDSFNPSDGGESAFKTQGRIIYTTFKEGTITIAYKALPVDEDGFPLLIDNPVFLAALEAYIKKQVFTVLFDLSKINGQILQHTEQEYAFLAKQCESEFTIPSYSEMQAISNMWNTLIPRMTDFYRGFKDEGNMELIKQH